MLQFSTKRSLSPVDYPQLEIDGTAYSVKIDMWTLFQYEKLGNTSTPALAGLMLGSTVTICTLLAASLGIIESGVWRPAPYTPEMLADIIPIGQLGQVSELLTASVKKVPPASKSADQQTPAEMVHQ